MGKYSKDDYEFEKNRQAILAMTGKTPKQDDRQSVWELEILEYRKKKKREQYMMLGSTLGIISFLLSSFLILNLFFKFI